MCFYAYKNVLEPMGHLGANLIFSILTLNQVSREYSTVLLGNWGCPFDAGCLDAATSRRAGTAPGELSACVHRAQESV